jgi:hypothetical protein
VLRDPDRFEAFEIVNVLWAAAHLNLAVHPDTMAVLDVRPKKGLGIRV